MMSGSEDPASEANARAATLLSWRAPFQGQTQHFLAHEIESIAQDQAALYARYLPIVQSSGTGKSRMVDETSKLIFTIPICMRPRDIPAIPPPDKSVRDFMTSSTRSTPDVHWSLLFLALFRALETSSTLLDPEHCSPEGWRTLFTQDMDLEQHNNFRSQFFQNVVQIAEKEVSLWFDSRAADMA